MENAQKWRRFKNLCQVVENYNGVQISCTRKTFLFVKFEKVENEVVGEAKNKQDSFHSVCAIIFVWVSRIIETTKFFFFLFDENSKFLRSFHSTEDLLTFQTIFTNS